MPTLISPYRRSAEIDLLQRLADKQNHIAARAKATAATDAIAQFVRQDRLTLPTWETPTQRLAIQRLATEAGELGPYLGKRFKLYWGVWRPA